MVINVNRQAVASPMAPGCYSVQVVSVEEKMSQGGFPYLKMGIGVLAGLGQPEPQVPDPNWTVQAILTLKPDAMFMLNNFISAIGGDIKAQQYDENAWIGKRLTAHLQQDDQDPTRMRVAAMAAHQQMCWICKREANKKAATGAAAGQPPQPAQPPAQAPAPAVAPAPAPAPAPTPGQPPAAAAAPAPPAPPVEQPTGAPPPVPQGDGVIDISNA